jgi:hypothetical protein
LPRASTSGRRRPCRVPPCGRGVPLIAQSGGSPTARTRPCQRTRRPCRIWGFRRTVGAKVCDSCNRSLVFGRVGPRSKGQPEDGDLAARRPGAFAARAPTA